MGGKAKPTKHTTKEINGKIHAAKMRAGGAGGGKSGQQKRIAPKQAMQPSLKSMQIHYEAKHPKENWQNALKFYSKQEEEEQCKEEQYQEEDCKYEEQKPQEQNSEQQKRENNN